MTPQEALAARIAAVTATAPDYTKTTAGPSGDAPQPAAAGPCRLRLVSYVELGQHEKKYQGNAKKVELCRLGFEVTGPKHPPREVDGKKVPHVIFIEETLSRNEKANFVKLFNLLNYDQQATHPVQLIGKAYLGTIHHRKWRKRTDPAEADKWTGIDVELRDKNGYSIRPPRFEDPETGDLRVVEVAEPSTPMYFFLWQNPDEQQWKDIFIEGEWPERKDKDGNVTQPARSKNFVQAKIIAAKNFEGSPIHQLLLAGGKSFDFTAAESDAEVEADGPPAGHPANDEVDPLAGVAATRPARGKAPDLMGEPD